nr:MAG TPA: dsDNA helicase [Caudoviricetes sp.]
MINVFRGYVKTKDKKPIQKFGGDEPLLTLEQAEKYDEYAGILNGEFTVIDFDEKEYSDIAYKIVKKEQLNCRVVQTTRGKHIIFKNSPYVTKGVVKAINGLGLHFDVRCGRNMYIVVKAKGKVRTILQEFDETKEIDIVPRYFAPIKSDDFNFKGLKDGDGRNAKLFTHIINLMRNKFSRDDAIKTIELINEYVFEESLPDSEVKQICRNDAFKNVLVSDPELEFGNVDLKPENFSDMAMAELFAKVCKNIIRYNPATDWLVWNGRVWEMSELKAQQKYIEFIKKVLDIAKLEMFKNANDEDEDLNKKVKAYYKYVLKMCDAGKISAVMKLAKSYLEIEIEELDANPFDLNTPEGIIDLKTGQMKPHDPRAMCTKMTMFSPSDGGEKMWDDFLNVITRNDKEFKNYLQYIAGQAVIGKIYHEGIVIAYGDGANGKSTLFNTIFDVLGDYSGKIQAEALTTRVKNAKVDLAELLGKRFILASETEEGQRLSIGMLKQIASVDDIVAEKKYHDPFTFTPSHLTVLYTNYLPKVGSNDKGIWRRLIVAPFNAEITNPQKDFAEKLIARSSGAVMKWLVEGAQLFLKANYNLPKCKAVDDAIKKYHDENDCLSSFVEDCCIVGKNEKVTGGRLYEVYKEWSTEMGEYVRRNRDFAQALKVAGYESKRTKKCIEWHGLSIDATRKAGRTVEDDFLN